MNEVLRFLRAMVCEDEVGVEKYRSIIESRPWPASSGALGAAFYLAASRRFPTGDLAAIIQWVADVRTSLPEDNVDDIDPRPAEWLIRSVVRNEPSLLADLDPNALVGLELVLTAKILGDEHMSEPDLDAFFVAAEAQAAQWATEPAGLVSRDPVDDIAEQPPNLGR